MGHSCRSDQICLWIAVRPRTAATSLILSMPSWVSGFHPELPREGSPDKMSVHSCPFLITGKGVAKYQTLKHTCQACSSKMKCCPKVDARKIMREEHEDARLVARDIAKTIQFVISMLLRKKVKMLFAHLKRILGLGGSDFVIQMVPMTNFYSLPQPKTAANQPRSVLQRSKRAKPNKKGAHATFEAILSTPATRCFLTKPAETGLSLRLARSLAMRDEASFRQWLL